MTVSCSLVVASLCQGGDHSIVHYIVARAGQVCLSKLSNYTVVTLVCDQYIVTGHFSHLFLLIFGLFNK